MAKASGPPGLINHQSRALRPGRQALSAETAIIPPPDGAWIDAWLSPARLSRYLAETAGDRQRAIALYEWNAQVSAALQRDLAHLEVGLRNAYDAAATARWTGPGHWLLNDTPTLFAPLLRTKRSGRPGARTSRQVDINAKPRNLVAKAIHDAGGPRATAGKVVAELNFGFWRYLSSSAHEKTLWVPLLHGAFPAGANRAYIDARVGRLHQLRNRVAHHEPLLRENLRARMSDLLAIAEQLHPQLAAHLDATSALPTLIPAQP